MQLQSHGRCLAAQLDSALVDSSGCSPAPVPGSLITETRVVKAVDTSLETFAGALITYGLVHSANKTILMLLVSWWP